MSIYGNPVVLGGSGGGGGGSGNAFASINAPTAADGENGQYWFQLLKATYKNGATFNPTSSATISIGGWEFTANSAITICGARATAHTSYTGTVKLADSNGTVLAEKSISLEAGQWVYVYFDSDVTLTAGNNYIITLFGNSGTLVYTTSAATDASISYVRGRYGGLPGTPESGVLYGVDVLIESEAQPPYPLKKQYYKSGGIWTEVT